VDDGGVGVGERGFDVGGPARGHRLVELAKRRQVFADARARGQPARARRRGHELAEAAADRTKAQTVRFAELAMIFVRRQRDAMSEGDERLADRDVGLRVPTRADRYDDQVHGATIHRRARSIYVIHLDFGRLPTIVSRLFSGYAL
jgi:hypothetical protein